MSAGFDNIADVQSVLADAARRATCARRRKISSLALGDRSASADRSDLQGAAHAVADAAHRRHAVGHARRHLRRAHVPGRRRLHVPRHAARHADRRSCSAASSSRNEQLEISINGERVALLDIDYRISETDKNGLNLTTPRIHVKAGPQRAGGGVHPEVRRRRRRPRRADRLHAGRHRIRRQRRHHDRCRTCATSASPGRYAVTGVSDTPSRRKIFVCRPLSPAEEIPCARKIVGQLASQAYRRPASNEDVESLMQFYAEGRKGKDFEAGISTVLQALLASPHFLFRLEEMPAGVQAGSELPGRRSRSRVAAVVLPLGHGARRRAAEGGGATARCTRRRCSRSRCAACWPIRAPRRCRRGSRRSGCGCRTSRRFTPTRCCSRRSTTSSPTSYKRETELLFDSIVREDRNVLDLFTADYTFVNERIAKVYRHSEHHRARTFQRVTLPDENRRGILGHGSILMLTSVADRTSPVQRGKWIMEVLLGSPPPPPPPNVPPLEDTKAATETGQAAVGARADGRAPEEPGVRVVPPDDRSARPRARELRRRRRVAHQGQRRRGRHAAKLYDGTELNGPAEPAPGAARSIRSRSSATSPRT